MVAGVDGVKVEVSAQVHGASPTENQSTRCEKALRDAKFVGQTIRNRAWRVEFPAILPVPGGCDPILRRTRSPVFHSFGTHFDKAEPFFVI